VVFESRDSNKYTYRRMYIHPKYGVYILELKASTFGTIYIPDSQSTFFKKVFSTENSDNKKFQALHHARANDVAASLRVIKASAEPLSLKELSFPPGTIKKEQYALFDLKGIKAVLEALPRFANDIVPWVASQMGAAFIEETKTSEFSTMTTTRQVQTKQTLATYPASNVQLDMGVVPFEAGPSLEIRYNVNGNQPRAGAYLGAELLQFLMDEKPSLEANIRKLETMPEWTRMIPPPHLFSEGVDEVEGYPPPKRVKLSRVEELKREAVPDTPLEQHSQFY